MFLGHDCFALGARKGRFWIGDVRTPDRTFQKS
jgi:hypothetical protein